MGDSAKRVDKAVETARNAIAAAHAESVRLGFMLWKESERTRGAAWSAWLAENGLDRREAKRLINLAKQERQGIDRLMLVKLGIVDPQERGSKPKTGGGSGWVSDAGRLRAALDKLTHKRPFDQWHEREREAVADQLKPLADLIASLQRRK